MAVEIEMKARVSHADELRQKLEASFGPPVNTIKEDFYFAPRADRSLKSARMFRVRLETGLPVIVTSKVKSVTPEGLEVNQESEFSVSDKEALFRLLAKIDFVCVFNKRKHTSTFRHGELNIELSEVPPIGYFLEIESMANHAAASEAIKEKITETFKLFGIGPSQYAPVSYTKLLREARREQLKATGKPSVIQCVHQECFGQYQAAVHSLPFEEVVGSTNISSLTELKGKYPMAMSCAQCAQGFMETDEKGFLAVTIEPTQNNTRDN